MRVKALHSLRKSFVQQFVHANNKKNIKFPHYYSFVWAIHRWPLPLPYKEPVMWKALQWLVVIMLPDMSTNLKQIRTVFYDAYSARIALKIDTWICCILFCVVMLSVSVDFVILVITYNNNEPYAYLCEWIYFKGVTRPGAGVTIFGFWFRTIMT